MQFLNLIIILVTLSNMHALGEDVLDSRYKPIPSSSYNSRSQLSPYMSSTHSDPASRPPAQPPSNVSVALTIQPQPSINNYDITINIVGEKVDVQVKNADDQTGNNDAQVENGDAQVENGEDQVENGDDNAPPVTPSEENQACPRCCQGGWTQFQNYCYRFFAIPCTWTNADKLCQAMGGHLVSINTPEENDFVTELAATGMAVAGYTWQPWIGLIRTHTTWSWTDGSVSMYENWYVGQSNGQEKGCGQIYADEFMWSDDLKGKWNDISCNLQARGFICKLNL